MNVFNGKSAIGDGTESLSESVASAPAGILSKGKKKQVA